MNILSAVRHRLSVHNKNEIGKKSIGNMQNFRNLKVWETSHQMVKEIYKVTLLFPKEETYGLSNQIRRSCISIPSNIAEGCGRGSDKDFARFVQIALGSASELEYQIFLVYELGYLSKTNYSSLTKNIQTIKKMLTSLKKKLLESNHIKIKTESR